MKKRPSKIIIISGPPSGVGKTSLVEDVLKKRRNLELARGTTTRAPRKGAKNKELIFVNKKQFLAQKKSGKFLETDQLVGNFYGTSKAEIARIMKKGKTPLLTITLKGFYSLKKQKLPMLSIFLSPGKLSELKKRILKRQPNIDRKVLAGRLSGAKQALKHIGDFDYVVINSEGGLKKAIKQTLYIIDKSLKA